MKNDTTRREEIRSRNPIIDVVGEYVALKRKGNWMVGCCPFHEETNPSFILKIGGNFASCQSCGWHGDVFKFIQELKGMTFPQAMKFLGGENVAFQEKKPVQPRVKVAVKEKPPTYYKDYEFAVDAIGSWSKMNGYRCVNEDWYAGHCCITRWEHPTKSKQFFPITYEEGKGWFIGRGKGKLPVYNLDAIQTSFDETVFFFEGEKTANCAIKLGLLASTSAGGANGFSTTDFSALAGRRVIICPDNGPVQKKRDGTLVDVGLAYAESVKNILLSLHPKTKVEILRLSGLPDGGDLVDWVEARTGKTNAELVAELRTEYTKQRRQK